MASCIGILSITTIYWSLDIGNWSFMKILFSLVVLAGLWLLVSPFALGYLGSARGNAFIVGLVVAVVGLMGVAGTSGKRRA
ncbi:SPW repeat protein [Candidatus Uhrbacteria bacterium]|nr:SPW repeat protein [Candidatus Uhrbacteria bacterium]